MKIHPPTRQESELIDAETLADLLNIEAREHAQHRGFWDRNADFLQKCEMTIRALLIRIKNHERERNR